MNTQQFSLYDYDVQDNVVRSTPKTPATIGNMQNTSSATIPQPIPGVPAWRFTIDHSLIYTVQTSGLGGSVSTPQRSYLESAYRSEKADDNSILTQWLASTPIEAATLLTLGTDAATEAARRLAIYKVRRDIFEVTLTMATATGIKLLDVVELDLPRFGMTSGRQFRVIGIAFTLTKSQVTLTLWG